METKLTEAFSAWRNNPNSNEGIELIKTMGFKNPVDIRRWILLANNEPNYKLLNERDKSRLEQLLPILMVTTSKLSEPDAALRRSLDFIERLSAWPGYLELLINYPSALRHLIGLVGASTWLSQFLLRQPAMVDELLETRKYFHAPQEETQRFVLENSLRRAGMREADQLIALRNFKNSELLHILALDLEGVLTIDQVSHYLTDLAELILETVVSRVSEQAGLGEAAPLGIIGYGKLGSREMSYASDTDIVFIYDETSNVEKDKLVQLAMTINRWMTDSTSAGVLYETDFRLRPHGDSGLLVTNIEAFHDYQKKTAWIWEHQALTRARWIAGPEKLGQAFEKIRSEILSTPRDPLYLRDEVIAMRKRMKNFHNKAGELFDVKHSKGGVVDVEFIVQYLILKNAPTYSRLIELADNTTVLKLVAELDLVPQSIVLPVIDAFQQYRFWMHRERLLGNEIVRVSIEEAQPHCNAVNELWNKLFN